MKLGKPMPLETTGVRHLHCFACEKDSEERMTLGEHIHRHWPTCPFCGNGYVVYRFKVDEG